MSIREQQDAVAVSGVGGSGSSSGGSSVRWWKEKSARLQLAGCGMLVVCGPFLAFPEILPPAVRTSFVLVAATFGFALAATLLGQSGRLRYVMWPLAGIALLAWFRSPNPHQLHLLEFVAGTNSFESVNLGGAATQHLAGLALGLLAMSVVASVSQSLRGLALSAALFSLASTAMLTVGVVGSLSEYPKGFTLNFAEWIPTLSLGLPGLESDGRVNRNALAAAALLVAPVNVALAFASVRHIPGGLLLRFIGIVSGTISILVLVVSQSRSAWLGACVVLIVLFARSRRRGVLCILLVGVLGVFLAGFVYAPSPQASNLGKIVAYATESALGRVPIWHSAIEELKTSRWIGIGLNQFHVVAAPTPFIVPHAHNIFIQLALDLGIIGLLIYGALQVLLLIRADRMARSSSRFAARLAGAAGLSLVGVHAFGGGDAVALGARIGLFQWLASGFIIAAWHVQAPGSTRGQFPRRGN